MKFLLFSNVKSGSYWTLNIIQELNIVLKHFHREI